MENNRSIEARSLVAGGSEATIEKAFAAERNVSAVRVAIVALNTLVYLFLLDQTGTIQWLSLAIIAVSAAYSLYVHFFKPYRCYPVMLSSYFISCTDASLITLWLYATGGIHSPYYVLWYAGIISIAFRYSRRETMMAALLYSACYLILLALLGQIAGYLTEIVVRIGYIFLIGAMGALFAQEALYQIRAKLELRDLAQRLEMETKERRRVEDNLRASEARLRLMIEQTPAVLWTIDPDLRFTSSLGAGLEALGLKPNQVVGTTLYHFFRVDDPEFVAVAAHRRALSGESVKFEIVWQEHVYQCHLEPLRDAKGIIIGVIAISFDITDSKQAEAQRLQLAIEQERVKLLERFISNISHDLKTPLSVIYANLYLLEKGADAEKHKHRLETINAQTQHLERLIQDILTMSRIETSAQLTFGELDLNGLVRVIYSRSLSHFEAKNLTVTLELDANLPRIQADQEALHIALTNLVENAVSYTPGGGALTLRTRKEGGDIVAEVQDTGIGIATEDLPHIFEQFYRADQARNTESGGTGLGLAMVRKVVEAHKGRVEASSVIGQGSTFRIVLPAATELQTQL